jgi:hypothetical protein
MPVNVAKLRAFHCANYSNLLKKIRPAASLEGDKGAK